MKKLYCSLIIIFLLPSFLYAQDSLFTNFTGMQFVQIPPGSFVVGRFHPPYPAPEDYKGKAENKYKTKEYRKARNLAVKDARNGFAVTIPQSFFIMKYEVTQEQWERIMNNNPSVFQSLRVNGDSRNYPVDNVTWQNVQEFITKLNAADNAVTYRLPTEFEWEYAARAGATSDIPWPEISASAQLGSRTTNAVGGKKPNVWGLYDMLGNVWEWVSDYYNEKIFADPVPPPHWHTTRIERRIIYRRCKERDLYDSCGRTREWMGCGIPAGSDFEVIFETPGI